jgi:phenylpropionate dioxygenase-like ring-hydroxylating dioxygenase large terminal subunit
MTTAMNVLRRLRARADEAIYDGPYSHAEEGGVGQFVNWYCRFLERNLSKEVLTDVA